MQLSRSSINRRRGLTLIEIIGVLAIIAILVSILTPKVITAIGRSKVSSTAETYNTLKVATTDYFARNGSFPTRNGNGATDLAANNGRFDADLIGSGMLEKLAISPVGSQVVDPTISLNSRVHMRSQVAQNGGTVTVTATRGGTNFDLDNNATTEDIPANAMVVSFVIPGVAVADAAELNEILDGTVGGTAAADTVGRCVYSAPNAGKVTLYLYVAHR